MVSSVFGYKDGNKIEKFTLDNGRVKLEVLTYGATISTFGIYNKKGEFTDVVLGYDNIQDYVSNGGYLGAIIGRVSNRIGGACFFLNGGKYYVNKNENNNTLHGGVSGFNDKLWTPRIDGEKLYLTYLSADGEEGFPGNLSITVAYSLTENNSVKIEYFAESDKDTVIGFTNHAYFNLNGQGDGNVLDTLIKIDADKITLVDEKLICDGRFLDVDDTPFNFNSYKKIGEDIEKDNDTLKICGGYDVNYVLNGVGFRKVAEAYSEKSKIKLNVLTDQPGIQFYSGNFLSGAKGKGGSIYNKRAGFCLETQNFPNAVNLANFPSPVLKAWEKYHSVTEYNLSIND